MMLLNAAGMRPEPAVSVASENVTYLLANAGTSRDGIFENTEAGCTYGGRISTTPVGPISSAGVTQRCNRTRLTFPGTGQHG